MALKSTSARISILFLSFLFIFTSIVPSYSIDEETIKIVAGQTKTFPTKAPTRVVIGNPNIADVVDVTSNEITVTAKAGGLTSLVYWDAYGEQSVNIRVLPEDTAEFKHRIDAVIAKLGIPDVYTKVAEEEGKVMLMGQLKEIKERDRLLTALAPLKDKLIDLIEIREEEAVIEIDVQVLELQKGYEKELGFLWPNKFDLSELGSPGISTLGTKWGNLWRMANVKRSEYSLTINLLEKQGKARILSHPRLSCQSGKEAKLVVGGEVPILSATVSGGGSTGTGTGAANPGSVDYKEYGIILKIKPSLKDDNRIHLNLNVEVSELGSVVSTNYALAYPLIKRTASTELFLNDGEIMAIGGLIKQKNEEDLSKFPWLADVPILGAFFRNRKTTSGGGSDDRGETELFITLVPRVVSRGKEAVMVKQETESRGPIADNVAPSSPVAKYATLIQKRVLHNLKYPALAKSTGFQGTVILKMHLSYLGELLDASVKESSGYQVLDEQTIKIAKGVAFYPPFPPAIDSKDLWLEIPVEYRLE